MAKSKKSEKPHLLRMEFEEGFSAQRVFYCEFSDPCVKDFIIEMMLGFGICEKLTWEEIDSKKA